MSIKKIKTYKTLERIQDGKQKAKRTREVQKWRREKNSARWNMGEKHD